MGHLKKGSIRRINSFSKNKERKMWFVEIPWVIIGVLIESVTVLALKNISVIN